MPEGPTLKQRLHRIGEIYLTLWSVATHLLALAMFLSAWPHGRLAIDMNHFGEYVFEVLLLAAMTPWLLVHAWRDLKEERAETD